MNDVALAARNNVLQSEAVLQTLGSRGTFTDHFWTNDHRFDVPYANGATLGDASDIERHREAVARIDASRPADVLTYIMDSFATLDLSPLGYGVRIADEWYVRAPGEEGAPVEGDATSIKVVETPEELAGFEAASVVGFGGVVPEEPGHTYAASLLSDGRFQFFIHRVDDEVAAGVMLFEDDRCVGVFTFFTLPGYRGRGIGTNLLRAALGTAPGLPLSTNPSAMSRGIFARHGFRPVGERRIWMRPAPESG